MKILFFTYDIPYPLDAGGKIRAYNLLKEMSSSFEITLFTFYRRESQLDLLKHLQPYCKSISVFQRRKVSSIQNLIYLRKFPFPASLYWDRKVSLKLQKELADHKYDLVHFESFYTSMYLKSNSKIPQVLGTENIEWLIYKEYLTSQRNFLAKMIINYEISRIRKFEINTWKKADCLLAVSEENVKTIKKESGKKAYLIPNGINLDYFNKIKIDPNLNILFVGNFNYLQNQDAVKWILRDIWPKIREKSKNVPAKLIIAGKNANFFLKNFNQEKVEVRDEITDIGSLYQKAAIILAPLRIGSGTKFKVLEGMASGLPVVTTGLGAEGINKDLEWGFTAETSDQIVSAVVKLLNNAHLRKKMGQNGKETIKKYFSWKLIGRDLIKSYEKIINNYC